MSINFEDTLEWANNYKPESVVSFSGPIILLVVAGIMITLLLVWWVVLIFTPTEVDKEYFVENDFVENDFVENKED